MSPNTPSAAVPAEIAKNPAFAAERLSLDVDSATDVIRRTIKGVSATETDEGVKFRTPDGMLVAFLTGTHYEDPAVELHYRTAPASDTATLKAHRIWKALEQYAG